MLGLILFLSLQTSEGHARTKLSFSGKVSARPAYHILEPKSLASERLLTQFQQNAIFSKSLNAVLGVGGWYDPALAQNTTRYSAAVREHDTHSLHMRDIYLQYQKPSLFIRVGAQQVVWGEAFGQFYSDIVNPKDYRDGFFGDFSDSRLNVPMVNLKLVLPRLSVQGILIPKPFFSLLPLPTHDFSFPFYKIMPDTEVEIRRQTDLPLSPENFEFGGRASGEVAGFDLSLFYFNYFDRVPYYRLNPESQLTKIILDEDHARIQSLGLTLTKEWEGFIMRMEGLNTQSRVLPTLNNNILSTTRVNNYIYVIGMDVPTVNSFNLGLQWSQDWFQEKPLGLLRSSPQSLVSVRLQRPFFREHEAELLFTRSVSDRGQRIQLTYSRPLSRSLEGKVGVDWLEGPLESDFGKLRQASRAFVLVTYFFKR